MKIAYLWTRCKMHIRYQLLGGFTSVETLNLPYILSTISCAASFLVPGLRAVYLQRSWAKHSTRPCSGQKTFSNESQHSHSGAVMDSFWFTQSVSPSCATPQFQVRISQGNATTQPCRSFADMFNFGSTFCWAQHGSRTATKSTRQD